MGIQDLTEDVLLVTLREEPGANSEVQGVTRMIVDDGPRHVIVDFSFVQKISVSGWYRWMISDISLHRRM